jgi:hypothetical protein
MPEFSVSLGYLMSHYWGKIIASLSLASYLRPTADSWLLFMLFVLSLSCFCGWIKIHKNILLPVLSLKWNELVINSLYSLPLLYCIQNIFLFHIHPSLIHNTHTKVKQIIFAWLNNFNAFSYFYEGEFFSLFILTNMLGIYYFHTCYALLF